MRWASVLALTVRVDATHSLGDAPPGNSTALPLALAAVRLLAMQIHGCVDVSIGDYLGGLSLFVSANHPPYDPLRQGCRCQVRRKRSDAQRDNIIALR